MSYLADKADKLIFLPLGGCNEIGMNLNLYGVSGKWIMVDLGMTFADPSMPGIDLVFPDISFIEAEKEDLLGLFLTHGHEDHIGAVPYLWGRLKCPIYATAFTMELVKGKLEERGLLGQVDLRLVNPQQSIQVGGFSVSYIPLAHSIAEGNGLALHSDKGIIFHTGDWKIDETPVIGPVSPQKSLTDLGREGVLALVGDSTNIFNRKTSGSELDVQKSLIDLVANVKGRAVITTFASNVGRLETIGEVAKASGRTVVLLGRSMKRIVNAAKETGYLQNFPAYADEEDLHEIPASKTLIACTGCQGEHRAALARIARGEHRDVTLTSRDTVIFSSKIIPGNELELSRLFNLLAEQDVNVITEKDAFTHVSGHPGQPDLEKMFNWVKPHIVIPVHGEQRHIKKHAEFAKACGIAHSYRPQNGDVIELTEDGAKKIDEVPTGRLALDGQLIIPLGEESLLERRRVSQQGAVTIHILLDDDGHLMEEVLLSILGVPNYDEDQLYDDLIDVIERVFERMKRSDRYIDKAVEEACRIAVRRFCRKTLGKNPGVSVLITRAQDLNLTA